MLEVPLVQRDKLRAPREHQGVLIEPGADAIVSAARMDHAAALASVRLLDSTVAALRAELRASLDLAGPTVVTGHQPEFFHPGVYAKSVAVAALAERLNGQAVHLIADTDLPKQASIAVPRITDDGLQREFFSLPGIDAGAPCERQPSLSRSAWLEQLTRVADALEDYDASLWRELVDGWLEGSDEQLDFVDTITRGRLRIEQALGVVGIRQLRVSDLAETPAFRAFAAHILLNAASFADAYNAAQADYRRRHRVRNRQRPAPPLAADGQRIEAPFWVLHGVGPRRRLFVEHGDEFLRLFADDEPIGQLDRRRTAHVANHAEPWPTAADDWRIRPRALTLSSFARLFLADVFIHGVGGAKYDEMTDDFVQRFFGVQPPPLCCVSATSYLPLPHFDVSPAALREAQRDLRDIRYNPQRHLTAPDRTLVDKRESLILRSVGMRGAGRRYAAIRRKIFEDIRATNAELVASEPERVVELRRRLVLLQSRAAQDAVAFDREYFTGLHLRQTMAELTANIRSACATTSA